MDALNKLEEQVRAELIARARDRDRVMKENRTVACTVLLHHLNSKPQALLISRDCDQKLNRSATSFTPRLITSPITDR